MKVGELIKYLEGLDPELKVMTHVPDINLDEILLASVEKIYDHKGSRQKVGRYEELDKGHKLLVQGEGFDAVILYTPMNKFKKFARSMVEHIKNDDPRLAAPLEEVKPISLDDIVRKDRDELQIRLANESEIQQMQADIDTTNVEDIYDNWSLISIVTPHQTYFRLIGEARSCKKIKVSSSIFWFDRKNNAVSTWSGPVYQLGTSNEGEPDIDQLVSICAYLHGIGIGPEFGVPKFT